MLRFFANCENNAATVLLGQMSPSVTEMRDSSMKQNKKKKTSLLILNFCRMAVLPDRCLFAGHNLCDTWLQITVPRKTHDALKSNKFYTRCNCAPLWLLSLKVSVGESASLMDLNGFYGALQASIMG